MLKKITSIILCIFIIMIYSQTILLYSNSLDKLELTLYIKNNIFDLFCHFYSNGLNSPIYTYGNYIKSNNIDIVIGNHINIIDFALYVSIIKKFDNRNIHSLIKKEILLYPFINSLILNKNYLKLNRKIENDIDNIKSYINNIDSGIIFFFPEGTVYRDTKHEKAKIYSIDNNYPIFDYTLFPKMKGLYIIINLLKEKNKLGNLISITGVIENFICKNGYIKDLLLKDFGNSYGIINTYKIPDINDYDQFKNWFLQIWKLKNCEIENYKNYNYEIIKPKVKNSFYILTIIIMIIFCNLVINTKGSFLFLTLLFNFNQSYNVYKKI